MRVKIHVDQDSVKPLSPSSPCVTVCTMDGAIVDRGRRLRLTGEWILRQYRNPVPCGASVVLYANTDHADYEMEARD